MDRSGFRTRSALISRLAQAVGRASAAMTEWHVRMQERRALMGLDERMLRDIGVTRADAEHEASKPFWRP